MKLIADSQGRLKNAELFTPGATFEVSKGEEGSIILRKLVSTNLRRVYARVKTENGGVVVELPPGRPADTAIEDAVRAERDSR